MTTTFSALAYIGPGGGRAVVGPLLGVVCAFVGAIALIACWPIRAALKRARARKSQ